MHAVVCDDHIETGIGFGLQLHGNPGGIGSDRFHLFHDQLHGFIFLKVLGSYRSANC